MNTDRQRRLAWLWKNRHTHDGDDTQSQITVIRETIERVEEGLGAAGSGAYIHLEGSGQTIPVDGDRVEFSRLGEQDLFEFARPVLPTSAVIIPKVGYYDFKIHEVSWDEWSSGGRVWVTLTRSGAEFQVWPPAVAPGDWTTSYGSYFFGVAPFISCEPNDVFGLYVDHGDSSPHDLDQVTVSLGLVDRGPMSSGLPYREAVLSDTPVAYWRLGEPSGSIAADETGNGHNGTYTLSPTQGVTGLLTGDPNLACGFSSVTGDKVAIPIHADLKFLDADYSLELWCNLSGSVVGDKTLFGWPGSGGGNEWGILYNTSGSGIRFSGEHRESSTAATLGWEFDTTYYVVVTFDASSNEMIIYVNGISQGTGTNANTLNDGSQPVGIGAGSGNGAGGVIDEVAVYDYVLTPSQIQRHYQAGAH